MLKYIFALIFILGVSAVCLFFFLTATRPELLSSQEIALFYLDVFIVLSSLLTLLGLLVRKINSRFYLNWQTFRLTFLIGIVLAGILTLLLFFFP